MTAATADSLTVVINDEQPPLEDSPLLDSNSELYTPEQAWLRSVTDSLPRFALKCSMGALFILSNIAVNTYSTLGNINEMNGDAKTFFQLPFVSVSLITLFAVSTLLTNLVSKINVLGDHAEGLELDKNYPWWVKQFIRHGPEEQFFLNMKRAIETASIYDRNVLVYIDDATQLNYDHYKLQQMKFLLSLQYNVKFVDNLNNNTLKIEYGDEIISLYRIVLVNCGLNQQSYNNFVKQNSAAKIASITFYRHNWIGRVYSDLANKEYLTALWTSLKSLLSLGRWMLTKGIPGAVVIFTILVSCSNDFNVASYSPLPRAILFCINLCIAWFGKMLINNKLKGEETDRELKKLIMRITHRQCPKFHGNHIVYLATASIIFILTVLPNAIVTPFLFAERGPQTFFNELNSSILFPAFSTSITISDSVLWAFTQLAVWTNVWMNIPTGLMAAYKQLKKYFEASIDSSEEVSPLNLKLSASTYKTFRTAVIVAIFFDSLVSGWNTAFNASGMIDDVDKTPYSRGVFITFFYNTVCKSDNLRMILPYAFAAGNFMFQFLWCEYKAQGYIPGYLKIIPKLKASFAANGFWQSDKNKPVIQAGEVFSPA